MKNIARWHTDVMEKRNLSNHGYNGRLAVYAIRVVKVLTLIVDVTSSFVGPSPRMVDTVNSTRRGLLTYATATRDGYYAIKQIAAGRGLSSNQSFGSFKDLPP